MDPVFSAKGVIGLLKELKDSPGRFAGRRVLFLHTGCFANCAHEIFFCVYIVNTTIGPLRFSFNCHVKSQESTIKNSETSWGLII